MRINGRFFLTFSGGFLIIALGVIILTILYNKNPSLLKPGFLPDKPSKSIISQPFGKMEKFKSDEDFREYMQNSINQNNYGGGFLSERMGKSAPNISANDTFESSSPQTSGSSLPERVSQTNVQVLGIDEPDIAKTNGDDLFYSQPLQQIIPLMDEKGIDAIEPNIFPFPVPPNPVSSGGIYSVKPFPPQSMKKLGKINTSGELLLSKNTLIVFNEQIWDKRSVDGYDVSDASSPVKKWSIPFKPNSSKIHARLYQGKLYLISRLDSGNDFPCPIRPFDLSDNRGIVACREIYHPETVVTADTIYTVSKINPVDGVIEKSASFVGSANDSILYMSRDSLYLTYHYSGDMAKIMYLFVSQNTDLYPANVVVKLKKLQDYDISLQAKVMEVTTILSRVTFGMDESKRLVFENNIQNRMKNFMANHARELERTGVVKVNGNDLNIEATGDVSGKLLNQYSMDEYQGYLRIATTTGQNSWFGNFGQLTQSFSDVYLLDKNLVTIGSVKDLGKSERIYSARFIADRGYVVTFRQTDPFYVLDLSNPNNPILSGELKIPGYSSYLHPLDETILGIGKEGEKVKLSLFDVSNSKDPQEIDKFTMSEYWSEALNNPHAFLADNKNKVFFIPGSQGGYVFSYKNNKLNLVAAVADVQVQRAIYINDYLYVLGQNKIVVLDENSWKKVGELEL